jgi:hypothetical protein
MRNRRLLLLLCLCLASSCHRKKAHAPASGAEPADSGPALHLTKSGLHLGATLTGYQFDFKAQQCESIHVRLLHVHDGQVESVNDHHLVNLPTPAEGSLLFVAQNGEPFGHKEAVSYSLSYSLKGAYKATSSSRPLVLEGPYTSRMEEVSAPESCPSSQEEIVLTRWLSKAGLDAPHRFETGDLEHLKKLSTGTKDEAVVVTIRWEPR